MTMSDSNKVELRADNWTLGEQPKPKRRQRKPRLDRALQQAKKAGVNVSGAMLAADGSVSLSFGAGDKHQGNELDDWMTKHARASERH
jgi:hypothetical protein